MKKPLSLLVGIALLAAGLLLPANPSVARRSGRLSTEKTRLLQYSWKHPYDSTSFSSEDRDLRWNTIDCRSSVCRDVRR